MTTKYNVVGKSLPRPDARPIVTGAAMYHRDIKIPNMLHTCILRSPHAHANIKSIDASEAEAFPGVAAVLTYKNIPAEWPKGYGKNQHLRILSDKVRFVGDPVAVVAAETKAIADHAVELINVEYEKLPAVFTTADALKPGAPIIHEEYPDNSIPESAYEYGDVEEAFAQPDVVIVETSSNLIAELPVVNLLEDSGTIAWFEGEKVFVLRPTQNSPSTLGKIADFTGIDVTNMRVMSPRFVGGSMNVKENGLKDLEFAVTLAKLTGRPVGVFLNKEEMFHQYHKERMGAQYKIGVKQDGTLMAVEGSATGDGTAYNYTAAANYCASQINYVANIPNLKFEKLNTAFTNVPPGGGCRGWIYMEAEWTFQPALAQAIEAIDMDPFDFFMKNTLKKGTRFYHDGYHECACDPVTAAATLAAEEFGWKAKWKGWKKPTSISNGKITAVGIGWGGCGNGSSTSHFATVTLSSNGNVYVTPSEDDFGNGQRQTPRRHAAEVLKIPLDAIKGPSGDTDSQAFYAWPVACGTYSIGRAVKYAAEEVRRQLFELAAPQLGVSVEDLYLEDRAVKVINNPDKRISWNVLIPKNMSIIGSGSSLAAGKMPMIYCCLVEVEVDSETGGFEVKNIVYGSDIGQIMSPNDAYQQPIWSLVMDGTREAYTLDKTTGRVLNPNYLDIKSRCFNDLPDFKVIFTETPEETAPHGARSFAEAVPVPVTPAIVMAIYNATGTMFELPITPDKILAALGKA